MTAATSPRRRRRPCRRRIAYRGAAHGMPHLPSCAISLLALPRCHHLPPPRAASQGTLVDPAASAAKCVALLLGDGYESGAHVDFYDLP